MKTKLIDTFLFPILTYGSESWSLTKTKQKVLDVTWMTYMRRCLGVTMLDKVKNEDILKRLNKKPLSAILDEKRHKYLAHVFRMKSDRTTKFMLTATLPGQNWKQGKKPNWKKQMLYRFYKEPEDRLEYLMTFR